MVHVANTGGEIKTTKRSYRRSRPVGYSGHLAFTREITLSNIHLFDLFCLGPKAAWLGLRMIHYMWATQTHLPDDISEWPTDQIRARLGVDPRTVRTHYPRVLSEVRRMLRGRRAPLCDGAREEIFAKSDGLCHHCGDPIAAANFHVDHLHPVSAGGLSGNENLVASCPTCNLRKGGRPL